MRPVPSRANRCRRRLSNSARTPGCRSRMSDIASGGAATQTLGRRGSCTSERPSCTDCQGSPERSSPPLPSTTPMPPTTLCRSLSPAPKSAGATAAPQYCRLIQLATTTGAVSTSSSVAKSVSVAASWSCRKTRPPKSLPTVHARGAATRALQPARPHSGRVSDRSRARRGRSRPSTARGGRGLARAASWIVRTPSSRSPRAAATRSSASPDSRGCGIARPSSGPRGWSRSRG